MLIQQLAKLQRTKISRTLRWCIELFELKVHIKKMSESYVLPVYEIVVDDALEFTCLIHGWSLPVDNELYKLHKRSVRKTTISALLSQLEDFSVCVGVNDIKSDELRLEYEYVCKYSVFLSVQNLAGIKFGEWHKSDIWRGLNLANHNFS